MKINGKTTVTMTLPHSQEEVVVDALISQDLDRDTILVSWHDLEALNLVSLSKVSNQALALLPPQITIRTLILRGRFRRSSFRRLSRVID